MGSLSKHKIGLAILDAGTILLSFGFAFWCIFESGWYQRPLPYPVYFVPSLILVTVIFLSVFHLEGLYNYQAITNPMHQLQSLMKCFWRVLGAFILFVFFLKTEYIANSRLTIGLGFAVSFFLIAALRTAVVPRIYYFMIRNKIVVKEALIIGAGEHGTCVCEHLRNSPKSYFKIVGFCDDDVEKVGRAVCGMKVLGTSYELESIIARWQVKEIIIAISHIKRETLLDLIDRCKKAECTIHVITKLFSQITDKMQVEQFGGLSTYRITPRTNGMVRAASKRLVDLVGSAFLLVCMSPLLGLIAWAIKRDSEGPVFYKGKVLGQGERVFEAYKFRSMISGNGTDPKENQKYEEGRKRHLDFMRNFIQGKMTNEYFVKDESRITRVGRLLRKYSLDELPQLINVLRGEMSLVGPRFCSPQECAFYKPWHKRRFQVKPGITGLWQVRARSEVSYDDMVMLDLYYIENWSLFFDFEILLRTIPVVLFSKGSRIN